MNLPYREPETNFAAYMSESDATEYGALIRGGTPFLVSADVDLAEGAVNVVPSDERFSGAFRKPVVVEEVRFIARSPDVASILGVSQIFVGLRHNFGGSIRCKFRVGRTEMSRDPIPVAMYAPDVNQDPNVTSISGLATGYGYANFRWVLPRPLLLRPQTPMLPVFSRDRDGYGGTARISIALVGRTLDREIPKGIAVPVPWIGLFETDLIETDDTSGTGYAVSPETAFDNPFNTELHVQRFVARSEVNGSLGGIAMSLSLPTTGYLSLRDPNQFYIVAEPVAGASGVPLLTYNRVFGENRNLPINRAIPPAVPNRHGSLTRKYYYARLFKWAATGTIDELTRMFMTMIGWREEVIS